MYNLLSSSALISCKKYVHIREVKELYSIGKVTILDIENILFSQ